MDKKQIQTVCIFWFNHFRFCHLHHSIGQFAIGRGSIQEHGDQQCPE